MLLDNEKRGKVHEWLAKYIKGGELDVVTGYFTVGALAWLSEKVNDEVQKNSYIQLHDRWSDPENEVRKRINSFPEKSPDILKPILDGLIGCKFLEKYVEN